MCPVDNSTPFDADGNPQSKPLTGEGNNVAKPIGDLFAPFYRVAFLTGVPTNLQAADFAASPNFDTVQGKYTTPLDSSSTVEQLELTSENLSKYASSLTIESMAQGLRKFTLTLTPPYEDAKRLIDNRLLRPFTLVKVQWGYSNSGGVKNDNVSDIHVFVNNIPKASLTDIDATITLSGYDYFSSVYDRRVARRVWAVTEYPNDASILKAILSRGGFDISTINPYRTPRLFESNYLSESTPKTTKQGGRIQDVSDWQFVRRIAAENDMWFNVKGRTIEFLDLSVVAGQAVGYNFMLRIPPREPTDVPMISFTANYNQSAFLPPGAYENIEHVSDPDAKTSKSKITTPPTNPDTKNIGPFGDDGKAHSGGGLGMLTNIGTKIGNDVYNTLPFMLPTETGDHYSYPISTPKRTKAVESASREAQFFANTSAVMVAPGIANLMGQALINVDVNGVGLSLGGPYLVHDVTHTLTTDGYVMRLNLVRTTSNNHPSTQVLNPPDAFNEFDSGNRLGGALA